MEVAIGGIGGLLVAFFVLIPNMKSCEQKADLSQAAQYETKMQECLAEKNTKVICEAALRQLGYYTPYIKQEKESADHDSKR